MFLVSSCFHYYQSEIKFSSKLSEHLEPLVYITLAVWLDVINFSFRDLPHIVAHIFNFLRISGTLLGISAHNKFFSAKWVARRFFTESFKLQFGPLKSKWYSSLKQAKPVTLLNKEFIFCKNSLNFLKMKEIALPILWNS